MPIWFHVLVHGGLVLLLGYRVVSRSRPTSSKSAWMLVLFFLPLAGAFLYLLIGERFMSTRRTRRLGAAHDRILAWTREMVATAPVEQASEHPAAQRIQRLTHTWVHPPPLAGNAVEFLDDSTMIFARLLEDIATAKHTCHLEFYIAEEHGQVGDILEALGAAADRGVQCRLLIDALGSRGLLGGGRVRSLERRGVSVRASLPFEGWRRLGARLDLRNHRKVVVIDSAIAYVGSLNLVDPVSAAARQGTPRGIDAMVRIRGPAVSVLAAEFQADWILESPEEHNDTLPGKPPPVQAPAGNTPVQIIATGPSDPPERLLDLLTGLLHGAQRQLVICTPYYVPDVAVRTALLSSARAGTDVRLIVPRRSDQRFVQWVTESYYRELLEAGATIYRHGPGFLHTKCVLIDKEITLFGSMNMDMRSVWLNFEVGVLLTDKDTGARARALLQGYEREAERLDLAEWLARSAFTRARAQLARLFAPLL